MNTLDFDNTVDDLEKIGSEMYNLMTELYPICRSITGDGVRKTDKIIGKHIPLEIHEVPTGTNVFDWVIPKEWNITDAYIIDPNGEKIIDFKKSNLHVMSYSVPIKAKMTLDELKPHLYTIPEKSDVIPYRISYYKENWGFCLSHNQFLNLKDGEYEVVIDSTLKEGSLTYGECFLPGETDDEILISCYTCHPSLCNDNLSGVVLSTFLAKTIAKINLRRYSYRFLFLPETIGAITWLSQNESKLSNIKHGLVVTCVGDPGRPTYKKSRNGNLIIDRAVTNVLKHSGEDYKIIDYFPPGSDERQYGSPGINLPVGSLMKTPYGDFAEYHTSADDLDFVQPKHLADSFSKYMKTFYILENNKSFVNLQPKGEPNLGKRGLYRNVSGQQDGYEDELTVISILNLSDGDNSLLDISERTGLDFGLIKRTTDRLIETKLVEEKKPS